MHRSAQSKQTGRQRVAVNLRALRAERGISQEELAHRAGIHRTYVGSIERAERNVSIDSIERLSVALGVDLVDLVCISTA